VNSDPPGDPPPASVQVIAASATARGATKAAPSAALVAPAASTASAVASALAPASASAPASAAPAATAATPPDPHNKSKPPLQSDDLTGQARRLFDAVKADDPALGSDFFFPREPFIPLKGIKNAGKYWDHLFHVYANDIHELHRKRARELEGAEFVSFELGSPPGWVNPGEESNSIGYFRTFNGKLRYKLADGTPRTMETKVIISWNNRWYITHLLPFKKN
jgi:hypothetical protein